MTTFGVEASFWAEYKESEEYEEAKIIRCELCPKGCFIKENETGKCGARGNVNGKLFALSYGYITSVALDPIEKKPLYEFQKGKNIVSIGSYGCNFHCPFCQNSRISMEYENITMDRVTPKTVVAIAKQSIVDKNIGIAYTYNEPLVGYEFVRDCSKLIKEEGLLNVIVTNGYINEKPLMELLPYIDAMNIDIKGGAKGTYDMVGGTQRAVKRSVEIASEFCHVEVTTLVLPDENESDIEEIAMWLASINKKIPYHLSRFIPRYKYSDRRPTPDKTMHFLKDVANRYLENVYMGNM